LCHLPDFSKTYLIPKPIDFSYPKVQNSFEFDRVYRIALMNNRELDLVVIEIGKTSLKFGCLFNIEHGNYNYLHLKSFQIDLQTICETANIIFF
jgi:hypothetical protein